MGDDGALGADGDADVQPDVEPDGVEDAEPDAEPDIEPEVTPETTDGPGDAMAETEDGVECGPSLICHPTLGEKCCAQNLETTPTYSCIPAANDCPVGLSGSCDGPEDCAGVCCMTVVFGSGGGIDSATTECMNRSECDVFGEFVICRTASTDCTIPTSTCCTAPPAIGISAGFCWSMGACPL